MIEKHADGEKPAGKRFLRLLPTNVLVQEQENRAIDAPEINTALDGQVCYDVYILHNRPTIRPLHMGIL